MRKLLNLMVPRERIELSTSSLPKHSPCVKYKRFCHFPSRKTPFLSRTDIERQQFGFILHPKEDRCQEKRLIKYTFLDVNSSAKSVSHLISGIVSTVSQAPIHSISRLSFTEKQVNAGLSRKLHTKSFRKNTIILSGLSAPLDNAKRLVISVLAIP